MSLHFLLGYIVSNEKFAESIISVPMWFFFFYFLVAFQIFHQWVLAVWLWSVWMCLREFIPFEVLWDSWICGFFFFFIHFEKFSGHYLFIFLLYLIFFLFFWDSNFRYVRPFWYSPKTLWCSVLLWVIRHRPPPIPFYFWVSVWTISIDLPANSVIFLSCTWSAEEPTGRILHLWHCILSF